MPKDGVTHFSPYENQISLSVCRYNVIVLLVTYVVPMCAMVACYSAMGRELWGSRSIGERTQRQVDSIRSKKKVRTLQVQSVRDLRSVSPFWCQASSETHDCILESVSVVTGRPL
jgi:hypothetical protein